jgi:hypothetical protein
MWCGGMKIVIYNENIHRDMLQRFFDHTTIENNKDINSLGITKRRDVMLTLVIVNGEIINMSYVHDFSDYYPDSYRIFTRTATLEGHRGTGFPVGRNMISAAGLAIHTSKMQIDFALLRGAKDILFTSNSEGGMESSRRMGRFLEKIEPIDPRFSYYDEREIYGCQQKVWRTNFRDLINMTDQI